MVFIRITYYQLVIITWLTVLKTYRASSSDEYADEESDEFTDEDSLHRITKKLDLSYSLESNLDSDLSSGTPTSTTTEPNESITEASGEYKEVTLSLIVNNNASKLICCRSVQFVDLIQNSRYIIDKTRSIRNALTDKSAIILITAPRKWGKTVSLTMIKTFLEIQTYYNGTVISPSTETTNYKLFKHGHLPDGKRLKKPPMLISDDDELLDEYQGKYPVIYISFKGIVKKARNSKQFRSAIKTRIAEVFGTHLYLLNSYRAIVNDNSSNSTIRQRAKKRMELFENLMCGEASDDDYLSSLKKLSSMLYEHFDKKVFILMDDYENPIVDIIQQEKFIFKQENLEFYYNLMKETFEKNKYIKKVIITGIFGLGKERIFSRIKPTKLKQLCVLNKELFSYIGIDEYEIISLYKKIPPPMVQEANRKYRAFRAGLEDSTKVYNPWSVCTLLQDTRAFRPYYEEDEPAGSMDKMFPVFLKNKYVEDAFSILLSRTSYNISSSLNFTLQEFNAIQNFTRTPHYDTDTVDLVLKYLLTSGYLTLSDDHQQSNGNISLTIPNAEMTHRLENYSAPHFVQHLQYESAKELQHQILTLTEHLMRFIVNNGTNPSKLEKQFTVFLSKMPPFHGAGQKKITKSAINPTPHTVGSIINSFFVFGRQNFDLRAIDFQTVNETSIYILLHEKRGVIIETKYGYLDATKTMNYPLQEVKWKKLIKVFLLPQYVNRIKMVTLLGIRVKPTKEVDICVKVRGEKEERKKPKRRMKGVPKSFESDENQSY